MSSIFGGSKSRSNNTNKGIVNSAFSPVMNSTAAADADLARFLSGDASGFNKFADAAGFNFELGRGMDDINSNFAGRSVFRSGARDKGLAEFGQGLKGRFAQEYISSLLGRGSQGLNAGSLVANVGQESKSSSSPGIGGFVGGLASGAAALKSGGMIKPKAGAGK